MSKRVCFLNHSSRAFTFLVWMLAVPGATMLPVTSSATAQSPTDAAEAASDLPTLVQQLTSGDPAERRQAVRDLGRLGGAAKSAVPSLLQALNDQDPAVRFFAARALGEVGERNDTVIKELIRTVGDPDPQIRLAAVEAMRELISDPAELVPLAAEMLDQEDQILASRALETIVMRGDKAIPFLIEALKNERSAYWACLAIEELGEVASPTAAQLKELLSTTEDGTIKVHAILALTSIGSGAGIARSEILAALGRDSSEDAKAAAMLAIGLLGFTEAESRLQAEQKSDDPLLVMLSSWALARLNPADASRMKAAEEQLVRGLASDDPMIRLAAVKGLDSLPLPADVIAARLADALDETDTVVAFNVVDALSKLGEPAAVMAAAALTSPDTRLRAAEVLQRLGPAAEAAVPELVKALQDSTGSFREQLQIAVRRIGPGAAAATDELIRSLDDTDPVIRRSAVLAIGSIGTPAAAAKGKLIESLGSIEDSFEQVLAAWAVAKVAPEDEQVAKIAVPFLVDALGFPNVLVQAEAAATLGLLGSAARPALEPLQGLADDQDAPEELREIARQAIESIR